MPRTVAGFFIVRSLRKSSDSLIYRLLSAAKWFQFQSAMTLWKSFNKRPEDPAPKYYSVGPRYSTLNLRAMPGERH
jgi:hypothetical protein